jgi:hypothetical protein
MESSIPALLRWPHPTMQRKAELKLRGQLAELLHLKLTAISMAAATAKTRSRIHTGSPGRLQARFAALAWAPLKTTSGEGSSCMHECL